jgi:hypothetical protein
VINWISETKGSPKRQNLSTQINGKFNDVSSAVENKCRYRAFI